jgi:predicted nucleotidyltransferase
MRTLDDVALAPAERQAIEAAAAALRARFPVTDIVLFGSKARGDSDPESDIDLLVLTSRPLDAEEQRRIWSELHDIGMRFVAQRGKHAGMRGLDQLR